MSIRILLGFALVLGCFACNLTSEQAGTPQPNAYHVIPQPASLTAGEGSYIPKKRTTIAMDGLDDESKAVIMKFGDELQETIGIHFEQQGQGNAISFVHDRQVEQPEGYHLEITSDGILLKAGSAQGFFYGTQTLWQLLQNPTTDEEAWQFPAVTIEDHPRFSYRGMHLDVARHFHDVNTVKDYLDQMAAHKMNYFHWHLTEDQGWRIEIKQYPKLTEVGAYRNGTLIGHYNDQPHQFDGERYGGYYTQEEVREIVAYAAERFITVVPEIELPGHAQAAIAAYPELGCTGDSLEVWQLWGVSENVFCPTEATFTFLENVLEEVIDLFPGTYIHIGGDECPKTQWKESAFCQQLMQQENLADEHELQSYFIQRIERFLNERGRRIIGWDEILEGGLAPNATVMSWRGIEGGIAAAQAGHDVIMTPTSHCYFDYYQSEHPDEPLAIGGFLPLEKVYNYEPVPDVLSEEEAQYILGTQANVWTEYIPTREKLDYMVFPRLCALAEVAWTAQGERDFADFSRRLTAHLPRLQRQGINAANHLYELQATIQPKEGPVEVSWQTIAADAAVHYTLDDSQPTTASPQYESSLTITESATIRAQAFAHGKAQGRPYQQHLTYHLAAGQQLALAVPPHEKYSGGGPGSLINGVIGSDERYGDAEWLGFEGQDAVATIAFTVEKECSSVDLRFFKGEGQWIYLPSTIIISVSTDGETYSEVARTTDIATDSKIAALQLSFPSIAARHLKVEAQRHGIIQPGRQGAGHEAWLFIDEIVVQ